MRRPETSLFGRLIGLIALVLVAGAGVLISAAWYYAHEAANQAYDRLLVGAAYQMAEAINVQDGKLSVDLPTSAFELLGLSARDRIFYRIADAQGHLLTGYEGLEAPDETADALDRPVVGDGQFMGMMLRIAKVERVFFDPAVKGRIEIVVGQTTEAREALAFELVLRASLMVLVMSLLALGGVGFAIRRALAPLDRLGEALGQRDPRDLTLVEVPTPREVVPFVAAINQFIERLKYRMDLMQQFIADAAHQIRTPLTALNAQVDLLSRHVADEQGQQHLGRIQARTAQLSRLANQLLGDAMVRHRTGSVPFAPVDLIACARRAFHEGVPDSLDADIVVSIELPQEASLMVMGDAVSLKEALKNLIDNAVRHGARTRLTVRVRALAQQAQVEIEDDGPGIAPEDWSRVQARFGAPSPTGSGLGLSIAVTVARAHGGDLRLREPHLRDSGADGFAVVMTLPRLLPVVP
jgi:two-component system sensor histidine kinase TctE